MRSLLVYAQEAARLDIIELNYAMSSEDFEFKILPEYAKPAKGVVLRIFVFVYRMFSSFIRYTRRLEGLDESFDVLFFVDTKNQLDSLFPVHKSLPHSTIVGFNMYAHIVFSARKVYVLSLPFFLIVIWHYFRSKGFIRRSFQYSFNHYWLAYGKYIVSRRYIEKMKPKAIVMSNDHSIENRTFLAAASTSGVVTVYLQHAQIAATLRYPVLAFDYALLDGEDALRKYDALGPSKSQAYLIGSPKYDEFFPFIKKDDTVQLLGIATNLFDPMERVEELYAELTRHFRYDQIIVRPHPAVCGQRKWMTFSRKYRVEISDSTHEHPYEFLKRIDVLIASDSNIHLEAAQLSICSLYYDFFAHQLDHYGFLSGGLLDNRHNMPADLIKTIQALKESYPNVRQRAKYYCDTIGTKYDGRSTELASDLIKKISLGIKIDSGIWEPILDLENLQAYRPK